MKKIVNGIEIELTQEEINNLGQLSSDQYLESCKKEKCNQVKILRESNLLRPTPHTITYGGNLINKTFNISSGDLAMFGTIIDGLKDLLEGATRGWTDATGERLELDIDDFKSLRNHLLFRDDQEHTQARRKIDAINALTTIEEVEAFDINEVIV